MRLAWLSLPVLLSGCWPYIATPPTIGELPDTGDTTEPDTTDTGTSDPTSSTDWTSLCAPGPGKLGPWAKHPISQAGVGTRKQNYTIDVGVDSVVSAARNATSPRTVSLEITGAIVSAVGPVASGRATLWASDENGTVVLLDLPIDDSKVQPGDRVKVTVTQVVNDRGVPTVSGGSIKVTGEGQDIWVERLMNGKNISYSDWPGVEVEVWGELATKPAACESFSGLDCFDLDHGSTKPVKFRVEHGSVHFGDCVHVIAPLDDYDQETGFTMIDPDWFQTY